MSNQITEAEIREMAKLTLLSNRINEIQEKNLKMFPMVFFNGVKSINIEYDLSNVKTDEDRAPLHANYVTYKLTLDETQDNGKLDMRFAYLEHAVRSWFWNDLTVTVYFNDRRVCESQYE